MKQHNRYYIFGFFIISFLILHLSKIIWAGSGSIEKQLALFYSNTFESMNSRLEKHNSVGQKIIKIESIFNDELILNHEFITVKNETRSKVIKNSSIVSEPGYNDLVENFVDNKNSIVRSIRLMQDQKLTKASLLVTPWSDDYWPIYKGILGNRYGDMSFPDAIDFMENFNYIKNKPAMNIVASGSQAEIAKLSPSEKYDLWIGNDSTSSLTSKNWQTGESYYKQYGKVETWMGICHGWAPASFMIEKPIKKIEVLASDNKTIIPLFPADLKALASLLWAESPTRSKFIGGRCNDKTPAVDENGRVISETCLNTNPGTWHLSIVNQIAVSKRSFIMDANYDYEVWNQPVYGYSYNYFNPQELQTSDVLDSALIPIEQFTIDKFKKYRSSKTKYVVGINMNVIYVVEKTPVQLSNESTMNEALRSVNYRYDLELDENLQIIGGEWYTNYHPDFLWIPEKDVDAMTSEEFASNEFDTMVDPLNDFKLGLNSNIRNLAIRSSKNGSPLGHLVKFAIKASRE